MGRDIRGCGLRKKKIRNKEGRKGREAGSAHKDLWKGTGGVA